MVDAQKVLSELPNLEDVKAEVEEAKNSVELHRAAMLSKRALHDEVRREGDERIKNTRSCKRAKWLEVSLGNSRKTEFRIGTEAKDNKEQLQNALAEPEGYPNAEKKL